MFSWVLTNKETPANLIENGLKTFRCTAIGLRPLLLPAYKSAAAQCVSRVTGGDRNSIYSCTALLSVAHPFMNEKHCLVALASLQHSRQKWVNSLNNRSPQHALWPIKATNSQILAVWRCRNTEQLWDIVLIEVARKAYNCTDRPTLAVARRSILPTKLCKIAPIGYHGNSSSDYSGHHLRLGDSDNSAAKQDFQTRRLRLVGSCHSL